MKTQVMHMLQEHTHEKFKDNSEELHKFEQSLEVWEASEKREIQKRLETHQVMEAAAQIIEHTPEAELRMTVGSTSVKDM
jgi:transcription elongation GreA/GreB family factor